jgi:hypothetical protein
LTIGRRFSELVEMATALKESVKRIGENMRADNAVMSEVERHAGE